jgi:hypothetical protein
MTGADDEAETSETLAQAFRLTTAFYAWEHRGRGWQVWPYPVELEPAFQPFHREPVSAAPALDDARKPTLLGGWFSRLIGRSQTESPEEHVEQTEPVPQASADFPISELQIALGPDVKVSPELAEHFLVSLSTCARPVSFEVVGTSESITVQIACAQRDAGQVQEQIRAYFPEAVISESVGFLSDVWTAGKGESLVVDFGLSQEFMRPLKTFSRFEADPLIGLLGSLGDLADGEITVMQVLFQSARRPWSESIARSVTDWQGEAFFVDAPELVSQARQKMDRPLFSAGIRVAVRSPSAERALQLVKRVGGALGQVGLPSSNELIALSNDEYPDDVHVQDVLTRQTRRSGMLLNTEELVTLVHPPSTSVRSTRLTRDSRRTKAVAKTLIGHELCLGENTHAGVTQRVTLGIDQRLRHTHLVGASGTGKSTLFLNMLVQDMEHGHGLALIDPHGDLVGHVLARVPDSRVSDVVLVDPADTESPVGFNILSAHSELEKTLLASDLVAVFRRLSTSWGDQMTSVLSNAILAFLESTRGGTLSDLRRFLVEAEFRKEFLQTVQDREVVYYWQKEFPLLSGRPQAPLLTRLDAFLRPRLIRNMVTQPTSLDFAGIMNEGKILLVKLAQGAIGEENAALLGSLFVSKIHQLALGRQSIAESDRRPFFVYMDEFQHFVTPSMAMLLTGARKYRLGLVLAHQELRQLWNQDRDVAGAVLANAATRICFRVGDDDAKKLEDGFTSFTARDMQNLGVGQAVCRVDRADWDFSLSTMPMPAPHADEDAHRSRIVEASRERYATPAVVEPYIASPAEPETAAPPRPTRRPERVAPVEQPRPATNYVASELPTALPGRGGAQHKYLQELIRRWGEANGWRVMVEKAILDGLGSVDVALERDGVSVACEVSVASTTDYEIGNIRKCLAAGFTEVVSVVVERRSLDKLKTAISKEIEPSDFKRVRALGPEELFAFLDQLTSAGTTTEQTTRGYRVKVTRGASAHSTSPTRAVAQTVVGALQRLRSKR